MKVKCFVGNYDGSRKGLVVAPNQKEAARIAGVSLYDFRQYWGAASQWPIRNNPKPFTLYLKPYDADNSQWTERGF